MKLGPEMLETVFGILLMLLEDGEVSLEDLSDTEIMRMDSLAGNMDVALYGTA